MPQGEQQPIHQFHVDNVEQPAVGVGVQGPLPLLQPNIEGLPMPQQIQDLIDAQPAVHNAEQPPMGVGVQGLVPLLLPNIEGLPMPQLIQGLIVALTDMHVHVNEQFDGIIAMIAQIPGNLQPPNQQ